MSATPRSSGMWTGLKPGHVALIASTSARFALRTGGGIVFLLLVAIVGLGVGSALITPVELMGLDGAGDDEVPAFTTQSEAGVKARQVAKDAIQWFTGSDVRQADYLVDEQPALLSGMLLLLLMLFPYVACFGGFNQTSGDVQSRGLRYVLLRTERSNIFLGRFLAVAVFSVIYAALLTALLVLYVGLKLKLYDLGSLTTWGAQGLLALVLVMLPYLALCAWISAAIDSPFGSLMVCLVVTLFSWVLLKNFAQPLRYDADTAARFLPWGWKYDLLAADLAVRLKAVGVMLAFTAAFLLLGLRTFHRRDL